MNIHDEEYTQITEEDIETLLKAAKDKQIPGNYIRQPKKIEPEKPKKSLDFSDSDDIV